MLMTVMLTYISPAPPLYLRYISPVSPLYLPCVSAVSPLYLPRISGGGGRAGHCDARLHLPCTSPVSPLISPVSQVVAAVLVTVMLACAAAWWVRELTWQARVKG